MTMKRRSSFLKPASPVTSTPSPNPPRDTSKMGSLPRLPSPAEEGSQTQPNGSRSSMMVEWWGTPQRMALTTSRMCARSMHPPNIQLTLRSHYLTGSTRPFKGPPPLTLPSSMPSKPPTTGDSKPMSCSSEPSTSASWPIKPNLIAPTVSSKAPSSPKTNAGAVWNARDLPSRFRIWQVNRSACPPATGLAGDGRRDEGVASKGGCDVIDLTNEDSSSDDEEL